MKYYIIGPYPPPLGGVSVYIYRHARKLTAEGHAVKIIDASKRGRLRWLLDLLGFASRPERATFYVNTYSFSTMAALLVRPFPSRIVFHDHSGRLVERIRGVRRHIFGAFLRKADECLIVGPHIAGYYERSGLELPAGRTQVRNAFLPPPLDDEARIWETYDPATVRFVDEHDPLLVANAYRITFHEGVDLYGLDMCVDLVANLKVTHPRAGLLFALAEIGDAGYYERIRRRIRELGVEDHIHFMTGQKELWPLFRKATLMIRPTSSDGYGVSVHEALYLGCPAVASDVCVRPEGTVTFRSRDAADLAAKVRSVLDGRDG